MSGQSSAPSGPDFSQGFRLKDLKDGSMLLGQAAGEAVILIRRGDEAHAVSAFCTHYGAPLIDGIVTDSGLHCPWHHACFSIHTGAPLSPPALNGLTVWDTRRDGELVFVTRKKETLAKPARVGEGKTVVIIGGGAAGQVAAETLRAEGFSGRIVVLSGDDAPPCDRPNLSKDYLAGNAPEEWIPLRPAEFYAEHAIEVKTGTAVREIDPRGKSVTLASGERVSYSSLLIATGASPLKLSIPGADLPHVHYLRSLADAKSLIAASGQAKRAVVIGASFIGLEVAASLRARGLEVSVVGRESVSFERTLGPELGTFIRKLHEEKGVRFELGQTPARIAADSVELVSGAKLPAELVVVGVGVVPNAELAERAGLSVDRGILVDARLETSVPDIFAAGDVARYPEPITGTSARIEHWVLAERQARTAALNILGKRVAFTGVPFFWSAHYDVTIAFTGYALPGSQREVIGSIDGRDCLVAYRHQGKVTAVATIGRDQQALLMEEAFEREDTESVEQIIRSGR